MASEVTITELGPGLADITVDGQRVPSVRGITIRKQVGGHDVVTFEVVSSRTTVTPMEQRPTLDDVEKMDAALDARMSGTVQQ